MGLFECIALVLIGLFAGLVGGMLGIGGSIVMIPAMTEVLGPNQHLYQAAAMIVNFFVVVPAVYQHRRARAIDLATVGRIMPLALVAVLAGVGISELPIFAGDGEAYLRGLFGLFLLAVALSDLYRLFRNRTLNARATNAATPAADVPDRAGAVTGWLPAAAVAIPTGLVAGLLGVGGGILAVPLQRRLLRVPIRSAIANSATIIIATSFVGAISKNYAYMSDHDYTIRSLVLAAILIPTAIIGSLYGSKLTHRLSLRIVKTAFFILLLVAALRLTYKAARSIGRPVAMRTDAHPMRLAPREHPLGPVGTSAAQPASTFSLAPTDTTYKESAPGRLAEHLRSDSARQEATDESTEYARIFGGGSDHYRSDRAVHPGRLPGGKAV